MKGGRSSNEGCVEFEEERVGESVDLLECCRGRDVPLPLLLDVDLSFEGFTDDGSPRRGREEGRSTAGEGGGGRSRDDAFEVFEEDGSLLEVEMEAFDDDGVGEVEEGEGRSTVEAGSGGGGELGGLLRRRRSDGGERIAGSDGGDD